MATWVKVEDLDFITYTRADGLAGYRIYKHGHMHAEQWMPAAEANPAQANPDDLAQWWEQQLALLGDTVSV